MKKTTFNLVLLLCGFFATYQSSAESDTSLGLSLQAGNNIPVSYTGSATTSLGHIIIQISTSGAGCGATNGWIDNGGSFPVPTGSSTIYLNTSSDWTNSKSIAKGLCPSGMTSQYMKVAQVSNQVGTHCTVNANCFTMSCSATGVVSGGLTGTSPTITCP